MGVFCFCGILISMRERDFYRDVQSWVKSINLETAVIELKLCKTKRFLFSDVKPHQVSNLLAAATSKLTYKIPDVGMDQKPFDICLWNRCYAYVAVIFYEARKPKRIYLINILDFIKIRDQFLEKKKYSLLEEDCLAIATRHSQF